jgi:hypothetical protein
MKAGASVSKAQLDSATLTTQRELTRAGFWTEGSRLLDSEVYWCWLPQVTMPGALGFFVHEADTLHSLLGYEAGHTYIPQWVLLHGPWQQRGSLRDVVRHEYGHAVAHYYPSLIQRSTRFSSTFGGRYFGTRRHLASGRDFVSAYATTCPAEDFAETFMLFLRHGSRLPARFTSSAIKRKWQFITDLAAIVESGGTKW